MRHEVMKAFSPEEDNVLIEIFNREGRKWGRIAEALQGRTSASVRNRFLRIEKGQRQRAAGKSKNRCAACGEYKLGHVCHVKRNDLTAQPLGNNQSKITVAAEPVADLLFLPECTPSNSNALLLLQRNDAAASDCDSEETLGIPTATLPGSPPQADVSHIPSTAFSIDRLPPHAVPLKKRSRANSAGTPVEYETGSSASSPSLPTKLPFVFPSAAVMGGEASLSLVSLSSAA
eukprot:CAMPEP_0119310012 /NCGR_PEP_ID=MMETSP1333-20130426/17651_1 /TAXON_ID=418940 /ORGANISM="Scyphosphaera apsteinii, Strain RCC1455" /LENGTH=231 /DNA_ID=CAMNT_0007314127 /DNA_START=48 /DNA_END=743 /DNA_ORIENTATION=+